MRVTHTYDPFEHAEALGITVLYRPLRASNGLWIPDFSTVLLQPRMKVVQERCVLAHELGHAVLGHRDDRPKHEVLADRWASRQLIEPTRLVEVMGWTSDEMRWAMELGVSPKLLRAWLDQPPLPLSQVA